MRKKINKKFIYIFLSIISCTLIILSLIPVELLDKTINKITPSRIINQFNNTSMDRPNLKYTSSNRNSDANPIVPLGVVSKCGDFDFKILDIVETDTLKVDDKTFNINAEHDKFILIKFRARNSSESTSQFYPKDYYLKKLSNNKNYYSIDHDVRYEFIKAKANKEDNLISLLNIKSGIIKDSYFIFNVPKDCSLDDLILESPYNYFELK